MQVKLFYAEIERLDNEDRADRIEDTAIGASAVLGGNEGVEKATDSLRGK